MDNVHESQMVDEPNADQLKRLQEIEAETSGSEPSIAKEEQKPEEAPQKEEQPAEEKTADIEVVEDENKEIPKETREEKFVRLDRHLKLRDKVKELT